MQAELQSLQEHGAWSIVEKPENTKVIPCKWVFKLKNDKEDKITDNRDTSLSDMVMGQTSVVDCTM
jgi:hypothetical protein